MAAILNLTTGIVFLKGWSGTVTGGTLALADGSASAPSLTFTSQTGTGLLYAGPGVYLSTAGVLTQYFSASGINLTSSGAYSWSSGASSGSAADVSLFRDAANILAQRNGTNAQTFNLYNTTDGTNKEFFTAAWSANVFRLETTTAGTGTGRAMVLNTPSAGSISIRNGNTENLFLTSTALGFSNQNFLGVSPTKGLGYGTGAGGTISQLTSKATTVILNTAAGQITTFNDALGAATIVSFTFTNSAIAATDVLVLNHLSGGTKGAYTLNAACGAGSAVITLRNNTAGSLSESLVISFALIKGATS